MHVKGLEMPAYDPRAAKITGLGYVTANRGGDHITGYIQLPTFVDMPMLIVEDSQIKDPSVADPKEARVLVDMENALTVFDAIGGCKFMGILLTAEDIVALIAHATGWDFGVPEFRKAGDRIYNLARAYCVAGRLHPGGGHAPGALDDRTAAGRTGAGHDHRSGDHGDDEGCLLRVSAAGIKPRASPLPPN